MPHAWELTYLLTYFESVNFPPHSLREINREKRGAKVVAAVWKKYLNTALAILQQGWFEERFLEEHPFWEGSGLVWWKPDYYPFFEASCILPSIHSAKHPFFNFPFLHVILVLNPQCGKELKISVLQTAATTFALSYVCSSSTVCPQYMEVYIYCINSVIIPHME